MNRYVFFLFLLWLMPLPAAAQLDDNGRRDSIYYMLDDGEQSPEEMEMEAQYVHGLCTGNGYQSMYFDCACLAGAFLQERERLGPRVLQQDIIFNLTKSPSAKCANTAVIAGQAYQDCMQFANGIWELASDNAEYCTCAANKTARDFERAPRLNIQYIRQVKRSALLYCHDRRNRAFGDVTAGTVN